MTESVHGLDDHLNRLLERCARDIGEDVGTFVARAVASRIVAELRAADSADVDEVIAYLAQAGVFPENPMPNVSTVIKNPDRLAALYSTGLLDTPPEDTYDRITRTAAEALHTSYATLDLIDVDRNFFKSGFGLKGPVAETRQISFERSISQYAVGKGTPLVLEDARDDPIFKNHPAVRDGSLVAYLGIPVMDAAGHAIGTLSVSDSKPRLWGTGHIQILSDLAQLTAEKIFGFKTAARP